MGKGEKFKERIIEKDNIECKLISKGKLPDDIWEPITGFSNADGGVIKLGYNNEGIGAGIDPKYIDVLQRDVQSKCNSEFSHKLYPDILVLDDKYIFVYIPSAPAALRPIYSSKRGIPNGARVRVGSSNEKIDDEWVRRFAIAAQGGAELVTFNKDFNKYFDFPNIQNYLSKVQELRGNIYKDLSIDEILIKLRAITDEKKITLFGLLAFSNDCGLQELAAPTVNIAITQYSGDTKVNPSDLTEVSIDDKEFGGNTVNQFEKALKLITSKLPVRSKIESNGKRLSYLAIPEIAIREVLANAIAHRDYTTFKSRIQIDIYSNRIEFASPGRSLVPIDNLENTYPETRNPLLMNFLKDFGITESRGRGIRTIRTSLKEAGLAEPTFENKHDWFVATLYSSAFITQNDQKWLMQFKDYGLNDRQLKALVHLKHDDNTITNSEYRSLNNMHSVRDDIRAKKDLAKLSRLDIIRKSGENRYRKYSLNPELLN